MRTPRLSLLLLVLGSVGAADPPAIFFDETDQVVLERGGSLILPWGLSDPVATVSMTFTTPVAGQPALANLTRTLSRVNGADRGSVTVKAASNTTLGGVGLITLTATKGGVVLGTATRSLRVNKPPTLTVASPSISITEDGGIQSLSVQFLPDDNSGSLLTFSHITWPADKLANAEFKAAADATTAHLLLTPLANAFTTTTPCLLTFTATDADLATTVVTVKLSITAVNDPPTLTDATTSIFPLSYNPQTAPLIKAGADVVVTEVEDLAATHFRSADGSAFLTWHVAVTDWDEHPDDGIPPDPGINGGDCLSLVEISSNWALTTDNRIRHRPDSDSPYSTIAHWVPTGTDRLDIVVTGTTNIATATYILAMVDYRWLLGTPATGSKLFTRSINITCDEPQGPGGASDRSRVLRRKVTLTRAENLPPEVDPGSLIVAPRGQVALALHVVSDDSQNTDALTVTIKSLPAHGLIEDAGGLAITEGYDCPFNALGDLAYHLRDDDTAEDSFMLTVSDSDGGETTTTLHITVAMPNTCFGFLNDPLLEKTHGDIADWPLRFTHPLSGVPSVHVFPYDPDTAAPPGMSVVPSADAGWSLHFDWNAIPADQSFVAIVLKASTASTEVGNADAFQPMLIRLRSPPPAAFGSDN